MSYRYLLNAVSPVIIGRRVLNVTLLIAALWMVPAALAQERRNGTARITKIDFNYLLSPKYQDQTVAGVRRDEWLQIMIEYESEGSNGWIDQLMLDWSVAILPSREKPILMKKRVLYADIEDGRNHAVMYIRPNLIKRYYRRGRISDSDIFVHIDVSINGTSAGTFNHAKGRSPKNWWDAREPQVTFRPDELLSRDETPFGPMDYDYYEHIKKIEQ